MLPKLCFKKRNKKLKDMAGSYCDSVRLVFASVFCANTIKSSYWGHMEVPSLQYYRGENWTLHGVGDISTLLPSRKQNLSSPPLQSKHTELWAAGNPESPGLCKYCFNFYFRNKNCCEQEANLWPILLLISQVIPVAILCINLVCLFHSETSCSVCLQFLVLCSWKWSHRHTV